MRTTRSTLESSAIVTCLGALAWASLALVACKDEVKHAGLVVRVESDLALPKDLDLLRLEVARGTKKLLDVERDLYDPASRTLEFTLPADGDITPVHIRGVGYKHGEPRVERRAITPVPQTRVLVLTLPLGYLCSGKLDDHSCAADQTCDQGRCVSARFDTSDLTDYEGSEPFAASGADASSGECFDVAECFGDVLAADVDLASCSFAPTGAAAQSGALNVALRFGRGETGICTDDACFVALDAGNAGWRLIEGSVQLPAAACAENAPFTVVYSTGCATKTSAVPPCWRRPAPETGSATSAASGADGAAPAAAVSSIPPAIGTACDPPSSEGCGMCGTHTRTCRGGRWSEWSECIGRGVCEPGTDELCQNGGSRVCGGDCQWSSCEGQRCEGLATQPCEKCGTQFRKCLNGTWSDWSSCEGQGACEPDSTEKCGAGGTRVCEGKCQWGECAVQVCPGKPSQTCGRCGTQRRSCDAATGVWSDWGACEGEGECTPTEPKECGEQGTTTCLGTCTWDAVCRGQACTGSGSMPCERCGTKTRSCDPDRGVWSDWSECRNQGECSQNMTRMCGVQGVETCTANCRWSGECTGQICTGESVQGCDRCGTQTRRCDTDRGTWSEWSSCAGQGACEPNTTGMCGSNGRHVCGANCQWGPCTGQDCAEELEQPCGRCGQQRRSCDSNTGRVSEWSACMDQGPCSPGDTQMCGNDGRRSCMQNCQWSAECRNQSCGVQPTRPCSRCGIERSTCNTDTGIATWSACMQQGTCEVNETQTCGGRGRQTCSSTCSLGACDCGAGWAFCGNTCAELARDPRNCGACGKACGSAQTCENGTCVDQCRAPRTSCPNNVCADLQTDRLHCGKCDIACESGMVCEKGVCVIECKPPESRCNAVCLDLTRDPNHCGSCLEACPPPKLGAATCTDGKCGIVCGRGLEGETLTACGGECVDLFTDDNHCGACNRACDCTDGRCPPKPIDNGAVDAGDIGFGGDRPAPIP